MLAVVIERFDDFRGACTGFLTEGQVNNVLKLLSRIRVLVARLRLKAKALDKRSVLICEREHTFQDSYFP